MNRHKRLEIVFLQETHSNKENETECGLWSSSSIFSWGLMVGKWAGHI